MGVCRAFLLKKVAEPSWWEVGSGKQRERRRDMTNQLVYLRRRALVNEKPSFHSSVSPG